MSECRGRFFNTFFLYINVRMTDLTIDHVYENIGVVVPMGTPLPLTFSCGDVIVWREPPPFIFKTVLPEILASEGHCNSFLFRV